MSTTNDIINYVTTTPGNTNPRTLNAMLNRMLNGTEGGDSSSGTSGVKKVTSLPENGENGDLCFVTKEIGDTSTTINQAVINLINPYFDIEDFYYKVASHLDIDYGTLTEQQKAEMRTSENLVYYLDDEFDIDNLKGKETKIFVPKKNIEISANDLENIIVSSKDGLGMITVVDDTFYTNFGFVASENFIDYNEETVIYNNENIADADVYFVLKTAESGKLLPVISIKNIYPWIEYHEEFDFSSYQIPSGTEGLYRFCLNLFYAPEAGSFVYEELRSDASVLDNNTINISFTSPGWYGLCLDTDDLDMKGTVTYGIYPINDLTPWSGKCSLFEVMGGDDFWSFDENGNISINNAFYNKVFDVYDIGDKIGLYIYTDGWKLVGEDMFSALLESEEYFGVLGVSGKSYPYLDSGYLSIPSYRYDKDDQKWEQRNITVNLNELKGTDLRVSNISYNPSGDTASTYSYKVSYTNTDDSSVPADFTFDVFKPDLDNERKIYFTAKNYTWYTETLEKNALLEDIEDVFDAGETLNNEAVWSTTYTSNMKYIVIEYNREDRAANGTHTIEQFSFLEIPDLSNYVTSSTLSGYNYLTSADLVGYLTSSDLVNYITNTQLEDANRKIYFSTYDKSWYETLYDGTSALSDTLESVLSDTYSNNNNATWGKSFFNGAKYMIIQREQTDRVNNSANGFYSYDWISIDNVTNDSIQTILNNYSANNGHRKIYYTVKDRNWYSSNLNSNFGLVTAATALASAAAEAQQNSDSAPYGTQYFSGAKYLVVEDTNYVPTSGTVSGCLLGYSWLPIGCNSNVYF